MMSVTMRSRERAVEFAQGKTDPRVYRLPADEVPQ